MDQDNNPANQLLQKLFIHSFTKVIRRLGSSVSPYKTVLFFKFFFFFFRDNLLSIMQSSHSGLARTQQYVYTQEKIPTF